VPFNSGAVASHDIGRQFDEHGKSVSEVIDFLKTIVRDDGVVREASIPPPPANLKEPTLPVGVLGPNAGGFYAGDDAGATATSADYAQVSIAWAEYMPDTIPPNILAINAITGDHWSSRWWANRAAAIVSLLGQTSTGVIAEPVTVTAPNTFALLSNTPTDAGATMEVVVNGRVFSGCASPAPFYVVGKQITWTSTLYGVVPGDDVIARYRFAVCAAIPMTGKAISLYYVATQGQTSFPLNVADRFSSSYHLTAASTVQVSRNGQRLMPDDGAGKGGFTITGNAVNLLWPAGVDETIVVDVWEQSAIGDGVQEAPSDGVIYGRRNAAWTPTSSSGTPSNALPLANGAANPGVALPYAREDHVHPIDTTRYAATNPSGYQTAAQVTASLVPYALTSTLPVASSTTPAMDGSAAVGTGTTWARADHVHPTDTSRAPLIAPAFTGNATFANGCTFVSGNLINGAVGTSRSMSGQTSGSTRWTMILGTGDAEGGSNAGSNFRIDGTSDAAGTLSPGAFAIDRHNAAVTINGTGSTWTSVSTLPVGGAYINLNKLLNQTSAIYGSKNQQARWEMDLGDATVEGGSNAGSNFGLKCYADNGTTLLSAALTIMRANGQVILPIGNVLNFANDAAAATGNVPIGGIYRNGSVLMIRAA